MAETKLRLLILSVGSLSAQNVLQALGARRQRCVVVGTNSIADAAGNFCCDRVYLVPPAAAGPAYIDRLETLIANEHPHLVVPTRDDDVLALAALGERTRLNTVLLTGTLASAAMMVDKVETARFAARHGLAFASTVTTARAARDLAAAQGLPLIGKPRRGFGSRGVLIMRSAAEIERAFAARADLIAQPFLDPPADLPTLTARFEAGLPLFFSIPTTHQSAQVMVGPDGSFSAPFGASNTQVAGLGTTMARLDDPELIEIGRAYARAAAAEGWRGPLNVQLKRGPDGRLTAFEINGRFGGATAGRTLMGFDEIGEAVDRFLPRVAFAAHAARAAEIVQRYPRAYPLPRAGIAALHASRFWSADPPDTSWQDAARTATSTPALRILILNVGSVAAQALIDAIGSRRDRCHVFGTTGAAEAAGNYRCDRVAMASRGPGEAHTEGIAELIRRERPDIVVPTCSEDAMLLARLAASPVPAPRSVLLTGTPAAAEVLADRMASVRFAERHGLPFVRTVDDAQTACALAASHGLPLIGVPRRTGRGDAAVILRSDTEIVRAYTLRPDLTARPFLEQPNDLNALIAASFAPGLPFFFAIPAPLCLVTMIIGPDGTVLDRTGDFALTVRDGGTRFARQDDAEALALGRAYAQAMATEGWRGPLQVELARDRDNRLTAVALRGDLGSTVDARRQLGQDDLASTIQLFVPGAEFPVQQVGDAQSVQCYPFSYPVPSDGFAMLRANGQWYDPRAMTR